MTEKEQKKESKETSKDITQKKQVDVQEYLKTVDCPKQWKEQISQILFTSDEIQTTVKRMAAQISKDYEGKSIICVGLLKGAFMFMSDLCRHLTVPYCIDFMTVSSYGKAKVSSGSVKIKKDVDIDPAGQHILIVEDLIDTGLTLAWISKHLASKNCASVKIACLLDKPARRASSCAVKVDYAGHQIPDLFVVGYGMDNVEEYRCIPFVGVLKPQKTPSSPEPTSPS
eukprot:TRINITY_DN504_c0_g1_i1.p1 TRINITY_DN504_c0_g1~~TRINITY_DN504_c0_g1_i1.p1  ORF type:complete len:227 (+),score=53.53 TRINITY_DN504_c0_g1_i1:62-742(+)